MQVLSFLHSETRVKRILSSTIHRNSSFESRGLPAAETKKMRKLHRTKDQILYLKKHKPQEIMQEIAQLLDLSQRETSNKNKTCSTP